MALNNICYWDGRGYRALSARQAAALVQELESNLPHQELDEQASASDGNSARDAIFSRFLCATCHKEVVLVRPKDGISEPYFCHKSQAEDFQCSMQQFAHEDSGHELSINCHPMPLRITVFGADGHAIGNIGQYLLEQKQKAQRLALARPNGVNNNIAPGSTEQAKSIASGKYDSYSKNLRYRLEMGFHLPNHNKLKLECGTITVLGSSTAVPLQTPCDDDAKSASEALTEYLTGESCFVALSNVTAKDGKDKGSSKSSASVNVSALSAALQSASKITPKSKLSSHSAQSADESIDASTSHHESNSPVVVSLDSESADNVNHEVRSDDFAKAQRKSKVKHGQGNPNGDFLGKVDFAKVQAHSSGYYLNIGTVPYSHYVIELENPSEDLSSFWPSKTQGIYSKGALFEVSNGALVPPGSRVRLNSIYLLLVPPNNEPNFVKGLAHVSLNDETRILNDWRLYAIKAKELNQNVARFFLEFSLFLNEQQLTVAPIWPPCQISTKYIYHSSAYQFFFQEDQHNEVLDSTPVAMSTSVAKAKANAKGNEVEQGDNAGDQEEASLSAPESLSGKELAAEFNSNLAEMRNAARNIIRHAPEPKAHSSDDENVEKAGFEQADLAAENNNAKDAQGNEHSGPQLQIYAPQGQRSLVPTSSFAGGTMYWVRSDSNHEEQLLLFGEQEALDYSYLISKPLLDIRQLRPASVTIVNAQEAAPYVPHESNLREGAVVSLGLQDVPVLLFSKLPHGNNLKIAATFDGVLKHIKNGKLCYATKLVAAPKGLKRLQDPLVVDNLSAKSVLYLYQGRDLVRIVAVSAEALAESEARRPELKEQRRMVIDDKALKALLRAHAQERIQSLMNITPSSSSRPRFAANNEQQDTSKHKTTYVNLFNKKSLLLEEEKEPVDLLAQAVAQEEAAQKEREAQKKAKEEQAQKEQLESEQKEQQEKEQENVLLDQKDQEKDQAQQEQAEQNQASATADAKTDAQESSVETNEEAPEATLGSAVPVENEHESADETEKAEVQAAEQQASEQKTDELDSELKAEETAAEQQADEELASEQKIEEQASEQQNTEQAADSDINADLEEKADDESKEDSISELKADITEVEPNEDGVTVVMLAEDAESEAKQDEPSDVASDSLELAVTLEEPKDSSHDETGIGDQLVEVASSMVEDLVETAKSTPVEPHASLEELANIIANAEEQAQAQKVLSDLAQDKTETEADAATTPSLASDNAAEVDDESVQKDDKKTLDESAAIDSAAQVEDAPKSEAVPDVAAIAKANDAGQGFLYFATGGLDAANESAEDSADKSSDKSVDGAQDLESTEDDTLSSDIAAAQSDETKADDAHNSTDADSSDAQVLADDINADDSNADKALDDSLDANKADCDVKSSESLSESEPLSAEQQDDAQEQKESDSDAATVAIDDEGLAGFLDFAQEAFSASKSAAQDAVEGVSQAANEPDAEQVAAVETEETVGLENSAQDAEQEPVSVEVAESTPSEDEGEVDIEAYADEVLAEMLGESASKKESTPSSEYQEALEVEEPVAKSDAQADEPTEAVSLAEVQEEALADTDESKQVEEPVAVADYKEDVQEDAPSEAEGEIDLEAYADEVLAEMLGEPKKAQDKTETVVESEPSSSATSAAQDEPQETTEVTEPSASDSKSKDAEADALHSGLAAAYDSIDVQKGLADLANGSQDDFATAFESLDVQKGLIDLANWSMKEADGSNVVKPSQDKEADSSDTQAEAPSGVEAAYESLDVQQGLLDLAHWSKQESPESESKEETKSEPSAVVDEADAILASMANEPKKDEAPVDDVDAILASVASESKQEEAPLDEADAILAAMANEPKHDEDESAATESNADVETKEEAPSKDDGEVDIEEYADEVLAEMLGEPKKAQDKTDAVVESDASSSVAQDEPVEAVSLAEVEEEVASDLADSNEPKKDEEESAFIASNADVEPQENVTSEDNGEVDIEEYADEVLAEMLGEPKKAQDKTDAVVESDASSSAAQDKTVEAVSLAEIEEDVAADLAESNEPKQDVEESAATASNADVELHEDVTSEDVGEVDIEEYADEVLAEMLGEPKKAQDKTEAVAEAVSSESAAQDEPVEAVSLAEVEEEVAADLTDSNEPKHDVEESAATASNTDAEPQDDVTSEDNGEVDIEEYADEVLAEMLGEPKKAQDKTDAVAEADASANAAQDDEQKAVEVAEPSSLDSDSKVDEAEALHSGLAAAYDSIDVQKGLADLANGSPDDFATAFESLDVQKGLVDLANWSMKEAGGSSAVKSAQEKDVTPSETQGEAPSGVEAAFVSLDVQKALGDLAHWSKHEAGENASAESEQKSDNKADVVDDADDILASVAAETKQDETTVDEADAILAAVESEQKTEEVSLDEADEILAGLENEAKSVAEEAADASDVSVEAVTVAEVDKAVSDDVAAVEELAEQPSVETAAEVVEQAALETDEVSEQAAILADDASKAEEDAQAPSSAEEPSENTAVAATEIKPHADKDGEAVIEVDLDKIAALEAAEPETDLAAVPSEATDTAVASDTEAGLDAETKDAVELVEPEQRATRGEDEPPVFDEIVPQDDDLTVSPVAQQEVSGSGSLASDGKASNDLFGAAANFARTVELVGVDLANQASKLKRDLASDYEQMMLLNKAQLNSTGNSLDGVAASKDEHGLKVSDQSDESFTVVEVAAGADKAEAVEPKRVVSQGKQHAQIRAQMIAESSEPSDAHEAVAANELERQEHDEAAVAVESQTSSASDAAVASSDVSAISESVSGAESNVSSDRLARSAQDGTKVSPAVKPLVQLDISIESSDEDLASDDRLVKALRAYERHDDLLVRKLRSCRGKKIKVPHSFVKRALGLTYYQKSRLWLQNNLRHGLLPQDAYRILISEVKAFEQGQALAAKNGMQSVLEIALVNNDGAKPKYDFVSTYWHTHNFDNKFQGKIARTKAREHNPSWKKFIS